MSVAEYHISCTTCNGQGKIKGKISAKAKRAYEHALNQYQQQPAGVMPTKPKGPELICNQCKGTGLIISHLPPNVLDDRYPKVAIIGAGIGGMTLAVACYQRGIPFTLFERDSDFNARSQGYGLTLQQASKALKALGINQLSEGIVSTKHIVHDTTGNIVGEWGMRTWVKEDEVKNSKKKNIHIARQGLRLAIYKQLFSDQHIKWGYQLISYEEKPDHQLSLTFKVNDAVYQENFDLVVGADGIRSKVRKSIIDDTKSPLRYLNCMVILGICAMKDLSALSTPLLDGATVFQTANGNDRIYVMPFDHQHVMWQLSFPIEETAAIDLNRSGNNALKAAAIALTRWHVPIPQIVDATPEAFISGYPVYDRALINADVFDGVGNVTLIGDAAHPMSPFKGQGANQAILDAIALARQITKGCKSDDWKTKGLRTTVLQPYEADMIARSAVKVNGSAAAAAILHTDKVLIAGNMTRGSLA